VKDVNELGFPSDDQRNPGDGLEGLFRQKDEAGENAHRTDTHEKHRRIGFPEIMRRIKIEGNAGCTPGHSDQSQAEHVIFPKPWEV
jgi:hypothetical protein